MATAGISIFALRTTTIVIHKPGQRTLGYWRGALELPDHVCGLHRMRETATCCGKALLFNLLTGESHETGTEEQRPYTHVHQFSHAPGNLSATSSHAAGLAVLLPCHVMCGGFF